MSIRRWLSIGLLIGLAVAPSASACGNFYYPNSYLTFGREQRILAMPEANFRHELSRIFDMDLSETEAEHKALEDASMGKPTLWYSTVEADLSDLRLALTEKGLAPEDVNDLTTRYAALRARNNPLLWARLVALQKGDLAPGADQGRTELPGVEESSPMLNFFSDTLVLQAIPKEFAMYCRGAIAHRKGDKNAAEREWKTLLELPGEERAYRSTWAAYMLAKTALADDPETSERYFAQVEELANAGFHDTLQLAGESYGWQARAELQMGDYAAAIQHYALSLKSAKNSDRYRWCNSLKFACQAACQAEQFDMRLTADPLCRRLIVAWLLSDHELWGRIGRWNAALREGGVEGPFPDADRLAWASYLAGDIEMAQHWVDTADPASPYAKWVRSKLLLRDGHVEEALKLIHSLMDAFPKDEAWRINEESFVDVRADVKASLGVLVLGRGEYVKALDLFLRADYWTDAAYIAERVLTISELRVYVNEHANDPTLKANGNDYYTWRGSHMNLLRDILANRLVRNGQWSAAAKYASAQQKEMLTTLVSELRAAAETRSVRWGNFLYELPAENSGGKNARRTDAEWASHVIAAAQIVREFGMELLGTEIEPDWWYSQGRYELDGPTYHRTFKLDTNPPLTYGNRFGRDESFNSMNPSTAKALSASDDEMQRVWKSAPSPVKRFHYRYVAADLMWQAARVLPDNDPKTLSVLYEGGSWIKDRDPKAADQFYKAIVRRCPNLPYAQEAERIRWFPSTPPDAQ